MKAGLPILLLTFLTLSLNSFAKDIAPFQKEKQKKAIQDKISQRQFANVSAFEINSGQYAAELLYRFGSATANVDFYQDRMVFSLRKMTKGLELTTPEGLPEFEYVSWEIQLNSQSAAVSHLGEEEVKGVNYFDKHGKKAERLKASKVVYESVYPNIDLVFYQSSTGALKYDFILHKGAYLSDIQMEYIGVENLYLQSDGQLSYSTKWGIVQEEKPFSYTQEGRNTVDIAYALNANTLGFKADFDLIEMETVLDPIYVDWSTYFYGTGNNGTSWAWTWVLDLDIDDSNNVYVTGMTNDRFPILTNAYDTSPAGFYDGFICKMSEDGDSILWFSYIGGSSYEYSFTLTVNSAHQPVIAGFSWSSDFPTTAGAWDQTYGGGFNVYKGFVTKFNSTGDSLVFSTFLGGGSNDLIHSMTLDNSGNVYITGETKSSDFPTTTGCYDNTYNGSAGGWGWNGGDAFLTKLNANGTNLLFSTYIGGANDDVGYDIQLSPSNEIYIVGKTGSGNFPVTPGSPIFNYNVLGATDGFVMKFKSDGKTLVYSKLMGGSQGDWFESVYINSFDEAYVAGISESSDFYTTKDAYQTSNKGSQDIVVVKMNALGQNVSYSTYIGGSNAEQYWSGWIYNSNVSISANVREEAVVCGISRSTDFPVTSDALYTNNPSGATSGWWNTSAVIAKLDYLGKKLLYGTYYGGSSYEIPGANKLRRISCYTNILYGGVTASSNYPTTAGVYKENKSSATTGFFWTGFISKFRDTLYTDLIELSLQDTLIECDQVFEIMDAKNQGADILWSDGTTNRFKIIQDTGTYWVQATYGCDTVRDTLHFILEYSPVIPVLPNDTIYCDSFPTLSLDAGNDSMLAKYLWNTGDTTQGVVVNSPDKYWVQIETPHCGTKTDTSLMTLLKTPDVELPIDSVFCDSVNIQLSGGYINNSEIYKWNTGDSVNWKDVNSTGYYQLFAENFCGIDSADMLIEMITTPVVILPADSTFCDNVDLWLYTGQNTLNEENYQWLDINNSVVISTSDSINITQTGLYALQATNKCASTEDSINLSILYTPSVNLGLDSTYCDTINYTLIDGLANNAESYLWDNNSASNSRTISLPGTYWLEISNKCGTVRDSIDFIQRFTPVANIINPSIGDVKDSIFCDAVNMLLDANTGQVDVSYLWNTGATSPSITADKSGPFKVTLNGYCGTSSDSVDLGIYYSPTVNLGADRVFCGSVTPFQLDVGQSDNDESYLWSDLSTNPSYQVSTDGNHWVQISNRCATVSDSVFVRISPYPIVDLGLDTILCGDFEVLLDAGNPGMTYLWEPNGENSQSIYATKQGVYRVHVTNSDMCTTTDDFEIKPDCISNYHIPNAFTPNGDGNNEVFKPVLVNYQNYELRIYNRWGELMFQTTDVNEGWDGTYMGSPVQQGVYLYDITVITTEDMLNRQFKGVLHLLR
ncbi:MAG: gliding motility-associated C-terminal domain-containing protein [Bacteroidia bacterium]